MGLPGMTIDPHNPFEDLISRVSATSDPYLAAALHPFLSESDQIDNERPIFTHRRFPRLFAQAPYTPVSLLRRLALEQDPIILRKLVKNPLAPSDVLTDLAKNGNSDCLIAIAKHENADECLLDSLDELSSPLIRRALCHNVNTGPSQLNRLLSGATLDDYKGFTQNPNADAEMLNKMWLNHEDSYLHAEICSHANCPEKLLTKAVLSENPLLRRKAAANPKLSESQCTTLLTDDEAQVRVAALRHLGSGCLTLVSETAYRVRRELARQKQLDPKLIELLAGDEDHWVRRWIARHEDCPDHLLSKLATDRETEVRRGVARNPNTAIELLRQLARDSHSWVRAGIAYRTDLDLNIITQLSSDDSVDVLAGLGRNEISPSPLLASIARHNNRDVRRAVILNHQAPLTQLQALLEDPYALNRALLCRHPALDKHSLWLLLEDPEPQVRFSAMQVLAERCQTHNGTD